jgi:hypothetical protein
VLVTPAHQFPSGTVLAAERRGALVEWAQRNHAVIVEDDYDAEYRYDREPIGAVQGLASDRVVYAGSASKTLAPALRLGWLVLPTWLTDAVAEQKALDDLASPALEQLAFADLLGRGEVDRHLRRNRAGYRAAATPSSPPWPSTRPRSGSVASRPGSMWSPSCRPRPTRPRWRRRHGGIRWASAPCATTASAAAAGRRPSSWATEASANPPSGAG